MQDQPLDESSLTKIENGDVSVTKMFFPKHSGNKSPFKQGYIYLVKGVPMKRSHWKYFGKEHGKII